MVLVVGALAVFGLPVLLAYSLVPDTEQRAWKTISANTVAEAVDAFKEVGFDPEAMLDTASPKIPPVFLAELPDDLRSVRDTDRRKALFVSIVLPHILLANDRLREDRARLLRLKRSNAKEQELRPRDRKWLATMAKTYRTEPLAFDELLHRVDVVPPRLAIAQAVQESGWGTSRFARLGNALFGQHAPVGANSITAKGDAGVALQAFANIYRSVLGYMENLNSHNAYREFRAMRASMRGSGQPIDAITLAGSLSRYSEEGQLYVERLRTVMNMREVAAAKGAKLAEGK